MFAEARDLIGGRIVGAVCAHARTASERQSSTRVIVDGERLPAQPAHLTQMPRTVVLIAAEEEAAAGQRIRDEPSLRVVRELIPPAAKKVCRDEMPVARVSLTASRRQPGARVARPCRSIGNERSRRYSPLRPSVCHQRRRSVLR